jgi:hypothetical protein
MVGCLSLSASDRILRVNWEKADRPAVRSLRFLVIVIPWFILTGRFGILLIGFCLAQAYI